MNSAVFKARRGMIGIEGFDGAHLEIDGDGIATVWTTTPSIGQGTGRRLRSWSQTRSGWKSNTFASSRATQQSEDRRERVPSPAEAPFQPEGPSSKSGRDPSAAPSGCLGELEAAPHDMEIAAGRSLWLVRPMSPCRSGTWSRARPPIATAELTWDPPAVAYPYATHACVVEVDPESGAVAILRYVVAEDCGRVINPVIVDGQIPGARPRGSPRRCTSRSFTTAKGRFRVVVLH